MTRISLPDGDWVDVVDRLNHAQMRRIRRATNDPALDALTEGVAAMATAWQLHDTQGALVDFPGATAEGVPSASLDTLPADIMLLIGSQALEIVRGAPDPKGTGEPLPGSPPDSASPSIPTSPMLSSSRITPAGPGKRFVAHPGN